MSRGKFITFEGIDGCGKSTQMKAVAQRLEKEGHRLLLTREPGGTPIAEKIRNVIMSTENEEMVSECELLLYLAARAQHVREKIEPALKEGRIVLCDRFQEATFAYQGYGRALSMDVLRTMNAFATGGTSPDLTLIFDITVDLSRQRLQSMNKATDRMESGSRSFYERIREGYQELARHEPSTIELVDGARPLDEITDRIYRRIADLLESGS
jgi:dTMP kinase